MEILNDESDPQFAVALDHALRFNGVPRNGAVWSSKHWTENTPCKKTEYDEMIDGLRGRYRRASEKEKPWPDFAETSNSSNA